MLTCCIPLWRLLESLSVNSVASAILCDTLFCCVPLGICYFSCEVKTFALNHFENFADTNLVARNNEFY